MMTPPDPSSRPLVFEPSMKPPRLLAKLFGWTRYLIILGVAAALLLSAVLLISSALTAATIAWDVASAFDFEEKANKELSIQVIELVDAILLGTVVYIVALGLYELFIDPSLAVPPWLRIESLDDLKSKLVGVVIVLLGVTFLRFATAWDGERTILYLGAGIAMVIAALAFAIGWQNRKGSES